MTTQPSSGKTAMKVLLNTITIGLTLLLSGCAGALFVGAGVGAGAFSYVAGSLTRVYEAEYQPSIRASTNVMKQLNFKQKEEFPDGLKTIIEGYHDRDTPVTIEVVYVDPGWTQIGVRTGYLGSNNLEISKQVHSDIANELKSPKPPPTLQATPHKKRVKPTDAEPRVSQALNDPPPPPQKTITASTAGINEDTQSSSDRQEKQALSHTEKRQDKTEQYTSIAYNNEPDILPPLSETVTAPMKSDTDDAQEIRERQEKQTLSHTESKNKTFIYDPESALTIHSGSYGVLDDVISYLDENPSASVDILAYINTTGNVAKNLNLSRKRVFEIRNYLILNGISEERITDQGLGENNFLQSNHTEQFGSLNHPVEMTIR